MTEFYDKEAFKQWLTLYQVMDIQHVNGHKADRKSNRWITLWITWEKIVRTHSIYNQASFFSEGNKASPIPIPPLHKFLTSTVTETSLTLFKRYNLDKKKAIVEFAQDYEAKELNTSSADRSAQARTKSERKDFRNGGRIISYTMSNTESWAWANPPTKRLKASSLKHVFNASQPGPSAALTIKNLRTFCFLGNTFSLFFGEIIGFENYCRVCSLFFREYLCWTSLCFCEGS